MSESLILKLEDGRKITFEKKHYKTLLVNGKEERDFYDFEERECFFNCLKPYAVKTLEDRRKEESIRLPIGCTVLDNCGNECKILTNPYLVPANDYIWVIVLKVNQSTACSVTTCDLTRT